LEFNSERFIYIRPVFRNFHPYDEPYKGISLFNHYAPLVAAATCYQPKVCDHSGLSKGVFLDECQELIHGTGTDVIAVLAAVFINLLGVQAPSANT